MCLDYVLDIPEQYKSGEHTGYKVLRKNDYHDGSYIAPLFTRLFTTDKWEYDLHKADIVSGLILDETAPKYKSGFHIFLNKEDAIDWSRYFGFSRLTHYIAEVLFKDVVAYGHTRLISDKYPTIVAKQIFLPSDKIEV